MGRKKVGQVAEEKAVLALLAEEVGRLREEVAVIRSEQTRLAEVLWRMDLGAIEAEVDAMPAQMAGNGPSRLEEAGPPSDAAVLLRKELWGAGAHELRIWRDGSVETARMEVITNGELVRAVRLPWGMRNRSSKALIGLI